MNFTVDGQINVGMGTNNVPTPELRKIFSELRSIDFNSYRFIKNSEGTPVGIELAVHNPLLYAEEIQAKKDAGINIDVVNGKILISISEIKEDVIEAKVEASASVKTEEVKTETKEDNKAEIQSLETDPVDELTDEEKSLAKVVEIVNNKPFKLDDGIYQFVFKPEAFKFVLVMHKNGARTYVKKNGEMVKLENVTKISPVKK